MIEIAISLAVIGFALVAIIGILPSGMQVQKENREETIINQEASLWVEAIRDGAQGLDYLTNYVMAITNHVTQYDANGRVVGGGPVWYTYDRSSVTPQYPITNGLRIVGLLTTPKYIPGPAGRQGSGFYSNYVVALVRSVSGAAFEKPPQNNASVRELAFAYRLISEVAQYAAYDPWWTNTNPQMVQNTNELAMHSNFWMVARNLATNLYDLRLTFRWPLLANNTLGNGRQTYRTMVSGTLAPTNEPGFPLTPAYNLYFFEPRTYVKAP